jgi:hypothetical protein
LAGSFGYDSEDPQVFDLDTLLDKTAEPELVLESELTQL